MAATFNEIAEQARSLAPEDRARLVETLLESLNAPVSEVETAWAREIEDRLAAVDRGETQVFPAEDVFGEARHLIR